MRHFTLLFVLILLSITGNAQKDTLYLNKTIFSSQYKVNGVTVKKSEFKNVLKTDPIAIKKYHSGSLQIGAGAVLLTGGIVLLASIDTKNPDNPPYWWQWAGGFGGIVSGVVLNVTGVKAQLASVQLFNSTELTLNTDYKGLQIAMQF